MKVDAIWSEARPLIKQIPVVKTLLLIFLILVVFTVGSFVFARTTGRSWYDTLPILVYITWRSARNWFQQPTTPRANPNEISSRKIDRVLPRLLRVLRNTSLALLVIGGMGGSIWLLITLLRWFWLHPLFR